jgi:hypothetical protein
MCSSAIKDDWSLKCDGADRQQWKAGWDLINLVAGALLTWIKIAFVAPNEVADSRLAQPTLRKGTGRSNRVRPYAAASKGAAFVRLN